LTHQKKDVVPECTPLEICLKVIHHRKQFPHPVIWIQTLAVGNIEKPKNFMNSGFLVLHGLLSLPWGQLSGSSGGSCLEDDGSRKWTKYP